MTAGICCHITFIRRLILYVMLYDFYQRSDFRYPFLLNSALLFFYNCKDGNWVWERSKYYWKQEDQEENAVTPSLCFTQVSLDRCSKDAWSDSKWPEKIQMRVIKLPSVNSIHPYKWKSKRMPATYLRCIHNNNLKMKTAGYSCRPQ